MLDAEDPEAFYTASLELFASARKDRGPGALCGALGAGDLEAWLEPLAHREAETQHEEPQGHEGICGGGAGQQRQYAPQEERRARRSKGGRLGSARGALLLGHGWTLSGGESPGAFASMTTIVRGGHNSWERLEGALH